MLNAAFGLSLCGVLARTCALTVALFESQQVRKDEGEVRTHARRREAAWPRPCGEREDGNVA